MIRERKRCKENEKEEKEENEIGDKKMNKEKREKQRDSEKEKEKEKEKGREIILDSSIVSLLSTYSSQRWNSESLNGRQNIPYRFFLTTNFCQKL